MASSSFFAFVFVATMSFCAFRVEAIQCFGCTNEGCNGTEPLMPCESQHDSCMKLIASSGTYKRIIGTTDREVVIDTEITKMCAETASIKDAKADECVNRFAVGGGITKICLCSENSCNAAEGLAAHGLLVTVGVCALAFTRYFL